MTSMIKVVEHIHVNNIQVTLSSTLHYSSHMVQLLANLWVFLLLFESTYCALAISHRVSETFCKHNNIVMQLSIIQNTL